MTETVGQMWMSFEAAVLPADAPPVQRQEMRRAFYAGAWVMLETAKALGGPEMSVDEGAAYLEGLEAELKAFYADVRLGRA